MRIVPYRRFGIYRRRGVQIAWKKNSRLHPANVVKQYGGILKKERCLFGMMKIRIYFVAFVIAHGIMVDSPICIDITEGFMETVCRQTRK